MPTTHELRLPNTRFAPRGVFLRSGLAAFLGALLSFCISLLLSIIGLVLFGVLYGIRPDMSDAYRLIAAPVAVVMLPVIFFANLFWEHKHNART